MHHCRPQTAPASAVHAERRRRKGLNAGQGRTGVLLVLPTLVLLAVVIVYPLIKAVVHVLPEGRRPRPRHRHVHRRAASPASRTTPTGCSSSAPLRRRDQRLPAGNARFAVLRRRLRSPCSSPSSPWSLEVVLGFWFAIIMNRTFKGRGLVRAAILIPWAIPTAVTAKLWFFIFAFDGIANHLLGFVGIDPALDRRRLAGPVRRDHRRRLEDDAVHGAADPRRTAVSRRRRLRGRQGRRRHARGRRFTTITLPLVKSALMVALLFRTLDVLRIYDLPAILTGGGGGTGTPRRRCPSWSSTRSGRASTAPRRCPRITFIIIVLRGFIFVEFLGRNVVPQQPGSASDGRGNDDAAPPRHGN